MAKINNARIEKYLKNSSLKLARPLNSSILTEECEPIETDVPALNIAFSGKLDGGISPGFYQIAGPSKHFKTSFGLVAVASYLKKYDDSIVFFFDSEFGASMSYFDRFGITEEMRERIIHLPFQNLEELKFELVKQLDSVERGEHVMFFIDSIGLSASKKEVEDALAEKSSQDMTRAKQLSSIARMITPVLSMKQVVCLAINHVYKTQEMFAKDVVSGGCVAAGTKIKLADGTLKNIEDVLVGDIVLSKDGAKPVTHVWNPETLTNGTPECYEIEFEDGYKVVCSENHKFYFAPANTWFEAKNMEENTSFSKISMSTEYDAGSFSFSNDTGKVDDCLNFNNRIFIKTKSIKSVGTLPVYDISVADSESYVLENGVITHNTKLELASQGILLITRSKEKDDDGVSGYTFNIKIMKSRFAREETRVPVTVTWDGGIHRWSGMAEIASKLGVIQEGRISRSKGYMFTKKDGTVIQEKDSDIDRADSFWMTILAESNFRELVEAQYTMGSPVENLIGE